MEIEIALRTKTAIFPILVDDTEMISPLALPESIRQLTYSNCLSVRSGREFWY